LNCFALNPLEVLEIPPSRYLQLTPKDVKIIYRKKSLLLHPDKCKHPRAQEAFDVLKKAETSLTDEKQKGKSNRIIILFHALSHSLSLSTVFLFFGLDLFSTNIHV